MQIEYICFAKYWFDKTYGNTYHSIRVTRCKDGKQVFGAFQYGYGEQYKQTALSAMAKEGWKLSKKIEWIVSDGTKKQCIANGLK